MKWLFFVAFICTTIMPENFNLEQVRLDLYQYKKPVYFCFTKDTYTHSFSENNLKAFQSYIKEKLEYNFIFHLEDHSKSWEQLAQTQHGIRYAMVCELAMDFGLHSTLKLYYQEPLNDMRWEQICSLSAETKERENWIFKSADNLTNKIKEVIPPYNSQNLVEKQQKQIDELNEKLSKWEKLINEHSREIEKRFIKIENQLAEIEKKTGLVEPETIKMLQNQVELMREENEFTKKDLQRTSQELQKQISSNTAKFDSINNVNITWNSFASPLLLGKLPDMEAKTVAYSVEGKIPKKAKEVLLYMTVHSGDVHGGTNKVMYRVFTKDSSSEYSKFFEWWHSNRETGINSQSENIWLPVTLEGNVYVSSSGQFPTVNCDPFEAKIFITGYR